MKRRKRTAGFTLVEVLVTMALYTIVILAVMSALLPAYQMGARYSNKETNNLYLAYVQGVLTDKIQRARGIHVFTGSVAAPSVGSAYDFAAPDEDGFFNMSADLFAWRTENGKYVRRAPIRPKENTDLRVIIEKLGDHAVAVTLELESSGEVVSKTEFAVKALNLHLDGTVQFPDLSWVIGEQSIQFDW